ncbi:MAG: hypothetical protein K0U29_02595 [Gammaproteobacteria bacterium]|nr:hypothetical protein [Gammaproteobacteria bacterium]
MQALHRDGVPVPLLPAGVGAAAGVLEGDAIGMEPEEVAPVEADSIEIMITDFRFIAEGDEGVCLVGDDPRNPKTCEAQAIKTVDLKDIPLDERVAILAGEQTTSSGLSYMGEMTPYSGAVADTCASRLSESIGFKGNRKSKGIKGMGRGAIRAAIIKGLARQQTWTMTPVSEMSPTLDDGASNSFQELHWREKSLTQALTLTCFVTRRPGRIAPDSNKTEPVQWHDARLLLQPVRDVIEAFDLFTDAEKADVVAALMLGTRACQYAAIPLVFSGTIERAHKTFKQVMSVLLKRVKHASNRYDIVDQLTQLCRSELPAVEQVLAQHADLTAQIVLSLLCGISGRDRYNSQVILEGSFNKIKRQISYDEAASVEQLREEDYKLISIRARKMLSGFSFQDDCIICDDISMPVEKRREALRRIRMREFLYARKCHVIEHVARDRAFNIFWNLSTAVQRVVLKDLLQNPEAVRQLFDTSNPELFDYLFKEDDCILSMLLKENEFCQKLALQVMLAAPANDARLVNYLKTHLSDLFLVGDRFDDHPIYNMGRYYRLDTKLQDNDARRRLCIRLLQALDQHPQMCSHEYRGQYIYSIYRNFYLSSQNGDGENPTIFQFFLDLATDETFDGGLRQDSLHHCFRYMIDAHLHGGGIRGLANPERGVLAIYGESAARSDYLDSLIYTHLDNDDTASISADIIQALVRVGFRQGRVRARIKHCLGRDFAGLDATKKKLLVATVAGLQQSATTDRVRDERVADPDDINTYLRRLYALLHTDCGVACTADRAALNGAISDDRLQAFLVELEIEYINLHDSRGHAFALLGSALSDDCAIADDGKQMLFELISCGDVRIKQEGLLRLKIYMQNCFRSSEPGREFEAIDRLLAKLFNPNPDEAARKIIIAALAEAILDHEFGATRAGELLQYVRDRYCARQSAFALVENVSRVLWKIFFDTLEAQPFEDGNIDPSHRRIIKKLILQALLGGEQNPLNLQQRLDLQGADLATVNNNIALYWGAWSAKTTQLFKHDERLQSLYLNYLRGVPSANHLEQYADDTGTLEFFNDFTPKNRLTAENKFNVYDQLRINRLKAILQLMLQQPAQRGALIKKLGCFVSGEVRRDAGPRMGSPRNPDAEHQNKIYSVMAMVQALLAIEDPEYNSRYRDIYWLLDKLGRAIYPDEPNRERVCALIHEQRRFEAFMSALDYAPEQDLTAIGREIYNNQSDGSWRGLYDDNQHHEADLLLAFVNTLTPTDHDSIHDFAADVVANCMRLDGIGGGSVLAINLAKISCYIVEVDAPEALKIKLVAALMHHFNMAGHDPRSLQGLQLLLAAYRRRFGGGVQFGAALNDALVALECREPLSESGDVITIHQIVPMATLSSLRLLASPHVDAGNTEELKKMCWHRLIDCLGNDAAAGYSRPILQNDPEARRQLKEMIKLLAKIGCYQVDDGLGTEKWSRLVARALYYYFKNESFIPGELDDELIDALVTLALEVNKQNDDLNDTATADLNPRIPLHQHMCDGIRKIYIFMQEMQHREINLVGAPDYPADALDERLDDAKLRLGLAFSKGLVRHYHAAAKQCDEQSSWSWRARHFSRAPEKPTLAPYSETMYFALSQDGAGCSRFRIGDIHKAFRQGGGALGDVDAAMHLGAFRGAIADGNINYLAYTDRLPLGDINQRVLSYRGTAGGVEAHAAIPIPPDSPIIAGEGYGAAGGGARYMDPRPGPAAASTPNGRFDERAPLLPAAGAGGGGL